MVSFRPFSNLKEGEDDENAIPNINVTTTNTGVEGPDNSTIGWITNSPSVSGPAGAHNVSEDQWFDQRLSHFDVGTAGNTTWKQRYWYNSTAYKPGGPVILFDIGEVEGSPSWVSYGTTVANALMDELGGLGIALEHRYYGSSVPTSDLSVDNLQWLNVKESIADNAWLATNLVIPELGTDIRAPGTPWIMIGGSYPGAKAAIMKVTYPTVFFGNIASASVVGAKADMWEYYDLVRKNLPPPCACLLVTFTDAIDRVLAMNDSSLNQELYKTFGLSGGEADDGQSDGTWDPSNGLYGPTIDSLCVTNAFSDMNTTYANGSVTDAMTTDLLTSFKAYATWSGDYVGEYICGGLDIASCLDTDYSDLATYTGVDQSYYRSWSWQYCSEFGFFQTSAPADTPTLVSRLINMDSWQKQCNDLFPPGTNNSLPPSPDTSKVTMYGNLNITGSRLAVLSGQLDAWLPVSALTTGRDTGEGYLIPVRFFVL
ncbi:peptidase S28 [Atractiella rhizophila]|nr:peptidase S28 [Atractiella rhizophila]